MGEHESDLPLQDSLGPELMKMLEDFGGVEGDLGKGTDAVGSTLDSAMYHGLDMYAEDASGMPLGLEPSSFGAPPELAGNGSLSAAATPKTPQLARSSSGACGEISPPASAFMAASGVAAPAANGKPNGAAARTPQKPRSIRRARSSLPAAQLQPRRSDEGTEAPKRPHSGRIRRATSVSEIHADVVKLAGIGGSPRSCSTATFAPFLALNAVETCPEVSAAMAPRPCILHIITWLIMAD